ncbi:amino acid adenylation domain-containing protein [Micromonospora sp. CA-248089]|uniref:amino acid adenylation domain-containing protein n=1 Tax=Micromonospora sp. CA-248089 TaxID=3239960 RepID=UPI003D914068
MSSPPPAAGSGASPVVRTDRPDGSAAACHALRVRLTTPSGAAETARRWEAITGGPLWVEQTPALAGSDAARVRRRREMRRPVPAAQGLRGVLIRHPDATDLVVVACRDVLRRDGLRQLAAAVAGSGEPRPLGPVPTPDGTGAPAAYPVPVPSWGFGDARCDRSYAEWEMPLDEEESADPAVWSAALAVLLDHYDDEDRPTPAAIAVDGGDPVRLSDGEPAPPGAAALLMWIESDARDGADYLPFLAPPAELTILARVTGHGGRRLQIRHRLRSVSPAMAQQLTAHLREAQRSIGRGESADARILDSGERERILALGRSPRPAPVTSARIADAFRDRAAATPSAVAVSDEDTTLTYGELERHANRVAHGLRARGVQDGDRVGVHGERCVALVAAVLGVLKAGGVYVPMDPGAPADRLRWIGADASLRLVVTTGGAEGENLGAPVVSVDELDRDGAGYEQGPPTSGVRPADAAYVIYTSGSTGRPKGVLVSHNNVTALLDATRDGYRLGPDDVWTFFHSLAFDFSVWEIWGCLLTGGHLVVVPYWVSRSPEDFRDLLGKRRVTVLSQTPSAFTLLAEADRERCDPLALRLVVFGGEALQTRTLLPWLDRHPESQCRLVNMYGITETTVHVTEHDADRGAALAGSRSVGRALPGWEVRVVDSRGRLAPPGVAGEIWVGGRGVALGYLNRAELDAQRFVADADGPGRLYRSGDRGRMHPDGSLDHLGRIDSQVKLRGFRIELDEIRAVAAECPGVRTAVVVLRRSDPGDAATARLDAYVVLDGIATQQVRDHLAARLPEYMLPATLTELTELPLTRNGKVAVDELPLPVLGPAPDAPAAEPSPDDGLSDQLRAVWQELFGFAVGAGDNFFALGGNSLLAVRMAALMRERGLPPLHPRILYLNPTVGRLAEALRA